MTIDGSVGRSDEGIVHLEQAIQMSPGDARQIVASFEMKEAAN